MPVLPVLRQLLDHRRDEITGWFAERRAESAPFLYTSVDVRHSMDKIAPVDTNLFPAGFNNLSTASRTKAVEAAQKIISPKQKILLLPEEHTRNLKYLDALLALQDILTRAGGEVVIGTLDTTQTAPLELVSASGETLVQQPLTRDGSLLLTQSGFVPELVVLNNDLSIGIPAILQGVTQRIEPPVRLGWYQRRKSEHFRRYRQLADEFCQQFGIDSWLITAEYEVCGRVDFKEMTGMECVAVAVEKLINRLKGSYRERGITRDPYVFIKSDSGTYGMGIMTARSGDEVVEMNRKNRKKMQSLKGGAENTEVIIQEGIPTEDRIEGNPAEPMLYLVNGTMVGGAYRVHAAKDNEQNLNSVGMYFSPLCSESEGKPALGNNCDYCVLSVIGALAALASAREEYQQVKAAA